MRTKPPRRSGGTLAHQRMQLPWPPDRPFRILSIDGGGICGILPASVLAELELRFLAGQSIAHYFDLIAGTSTGGIIALALGCGMTAASVRDLYMERGAAIFPSAPWPVTQLRRMRRFVRYAYDSRALEKELRQTYANSKFGDAITRLCIPAFEGRYGEPWIFKTPHHPDYVIDRYYDIVTVGMATAAAPTYFRAVENDGYVMVDGGIWANNPIMVAIVDALTCFDIDRHRIYVLSLGCGETRHRVTARHAVGGIFQWRDIMRAATRAQSHNALGQGYLLLGKNNIMRIDAPESSHPIELDDYVRARDELPHLARSLVDASSHELERTFLVGKVTPFVATPVPI